MTTEMHGHGHGDHAAMFRRRFWWSLLLTVPVVATADMVMDWFGYRLEFSGIDWVGPVLGSIIFFWGGRPFLAGAVSELRARRPGMMLLITMAIVVAYGASLATTFDWLDLEFWWELAALITIMLLGHWLEMKALGQAQSALAALADLLPDEADRIGPGGTIETVGLAALRLGDVVLVRPGGRVPADGVIVDGDAELDESMVTGESRPVAKGAGDRVVAGTVSTDSSIRVRVDAVGDDTTLAGIRRLVEQAQSSQSRAQALADRFAALLFYVAAGAGLVTFVAWAAGGDTNEAIIRTVTVLVIACPHTLGLAIPLVISLSSRARRAGGHPRQEPLGPRTDAHGRRGALRQDRDPDAGSARGDRYGRRRSTRRPGVAPRGRGRSRQRASVGRARSSPPRPPRARSWARPTSSR